MSLQKNHTHETKKILELAVKMKETRTAENMTHNQKMAYVKDFYKIK